MVNLSVAARFIAGACILFAASSGALKKSSSASSSSSGRSADSLIDSAFSEFVEETHGHAPTGIDDALEENKNAPPAPPTVAQSAPPAEPTVALAQRRTTRYDPELVRQAMELGERAVRRTAFNVSDCATSATKAATEYCQKVFREKVLPDANFSKRLEDMLPDLSPNLQELAQYKTIFKLIDSDHDGSLLAWEIFQHFNDASVCGWVLRHGVDTCPDAPDMIWSFDEDDDKHINFDEFYVGMKRSTLKVMPKMVAAPRYDGKSCDVEQSDAARVFDLRGADATEARCKAQCSLTLSCIMFSGVWGSWCIGCNKPMDLAATPNALAYVKQTTTTTTTTTTQAIVDGWSIGARGESCAATCGSMGMLCTEQGLFQHNSEIDSQAELEAIIGTSCSHGYNTAWLTAADGPLFGLQGDDNACLATGSGRALSTFSCAAKAKHDAKRVCYCFQTTTTTTTLAQSYRKEENKACGYGGACTGDESKLNIGANGGYASEDGASVADCKATCDSASECAGFTYQKPKTGTPTKCWFRRSTTCNMDNSNARDCYTKACSLFTTAASCPTTRCMWDYNACKVPTTTTTVPVKHGFRSISVGGTSNPAYVSGPLFSDRWQDRLVDKSFLGVVNGWKSKDIATCGLEVTHRSVTGVKPTRRTASAKGPTSAVDVVEKHVQVTIPKIREERVPYLVNVTQDRMVYNTTIQKVPKYVPVETVKKVRREVEVPKIVEVIKNVTVPGPINQVVRKREKKVTMDLVTVRVDQVAVPMVLTEQTPVYHNVTKKVQRYVTTAKVVKRQIPVNVTKIEEVLVELPANVSFNATNTSFPSDFETIEVEVAKVTVQQVKVPIQIMRDKVVYKTIKQAVERRVEKPEVKVLQKIVEVPEYKEVLKQVPIVEVRNRTVELIREELVVEDDEEIVNVTKERLVPSEISKMKSVPVFTETPQISYSNVDIPQVEVNITPVKTQEFVDAVERTNITQEVIQKTEEIEYVDKYVDVIIEQEVIVEVPKRIVRTIMKEVVVENVREEIVQVPEPQIVTLTREEPEIVFESVDVVLHREELVANEINSLKTLLSEQVIPVQTWEEIETTKLVPKPFPVSESEAVIDFAHDHETTSDGSPVEGNATRVQEQVIVQDFVEQEVVKKVPYPQTNIVTRDVHIPVFEIQEEEVPVSTVRYEDEIVEVEKIYEQETIVEVPGPPVDTYFDEDVIVPEYVPKNVVARVETPQVTFNRTNFSVPVYRLEEEIISETKEIYEDEIVEVPQVLKVNRYVLNGSGNNLEASGPKASGPTVSYVEKEVIQIMQIAEPVYVDREVEVPVYEVEEVIVEVPKVTVVEEVVEVPRVIEIERVVEVPTVEYNDVVVEKVVKKRVKQKKTREHVVFVDKVVEKISEHVQIDNEIRYVDLEVQVPNYIAQVNQVTQADTNRTLSVSQKTVTAVRTKPVTVKKKVERLVPNEIVKIVKKQVEVLHETIVEKVVPIYKETVIKKEVKVPVIAIKELIVKKKLVQQVANSTTNSSQTIVDLHVENGEKQTKKVEVPLRVMLKPIVVKREVPIAVPCGGTAVPVLPPALPVLAPAPGPAPEASAAVDTVV